ncbi:MAG: MarR family transcriptional regulator [Saprospiraceae bacterium]|nr:MarR family transcriptional regulator [Saprospiraceae bacterium]
MDAIIDEFRAFNRSYTQVLGLLDRHILNSPFSLAEGRILFELHRAQPVTPKELGEMLQMDKGFVSRILTGFVRRKLLRKVRNPQDARSWVLQLTPSGEQAFLAINEASNGQIQRLLDPLGNEARRDMIHSMRKLSRQLNRFGEYPPKPQLDEIQIRTQLNPGDLINLIQLHGEVYREEYQYGTTFEAYVAQGIAEFYHQYDPKTNRIWIAEHLGHQVGYLALADRGTVAQLRFFVIDSNYRGIGLGKRMMELFMQFLKECNFTGAYLWTTHELPTAAALYRRFGFRLTEEKPSKAFDKPVIEHRYDLAH